MYKNQNLICSYLLYKNPRTYAQKSVKRQNLICSYLLYKNPCTCTQKSVKNLKQYDIL
jgi:hypothetical protein